MSGSAIAITGASGYVGSILASHLEERGKTVIRLSRSPQKTSSHSAAFSLEATLPSRFFSENGIGTLIHAAWDLGLVKEKDVCRVNVEGSSRLLQSAGEGGVNRVIFISTMSAFEGCKSIYGRAKLEIEKRVSKIEGQIVRPGLIYGPSPGGMVGSLTEAVRTKSLLPVIHTRAPLYLVHENDLASVVERLVDVPNIIERPITAANPRPFSLGEIVRTLSELQRRHVRIVPVPWPAFWFPLRIMELAGIKAGYRSDSVISLVNQNRSPDFEPARTLGIDFREFPGGVNS